MDAAQSPPRAGPPGRLAFISAIGFGQICSWGTLYYAFPLIAEQIERALVRNAQVADFANTSVLYSRWCEATASALPTPGKHLSGSDRLKLITKRMESMAAVDEAALA